MYAESLTYDLYLRENAKSRPEFAADTTAHKAAFHAFFAEEAAIRTLLPHYEGYDTKQISKMTHLEWFTYPVWNIEAAKAGEMVQTETAVLFDYQKRSLLTKEAMVYVIENIGQ